MRCARESQIREQFYFEDFTVGQKFRSGSFRMERNRIIEFAQEFDPQPQHVGEESAASSNFGELVASGWHTAALSMRLFIQDALPSIPGGGQGLGVESLTWPHPVRPGDELTVEVEVLATRPSRSRPGQGIVKVRNITSNAEGRVVENMTTSFLAPRRRLA